MSCNYLFLYDNAYISYTINVDCYVYVTKNEKVPAFAMHLPTAYEKI